MVYALLSILSLYESINKIVINRLIWAIKSMLLNSRMIINSSIVSFLYWNNQIKFIYVLTK